MNKKLKQKVKDSPLKKIEIAKRVGISRPYLDKIIDETHKPSLPIIKGLMKVLNCPFDKLFGDEE